MWPAHPCGDGEFRRSKNINRPVGATNFSPAAAPALKGPKDGLRERGLVQKYNIEFLHAGFIRDKARLEEELEAALKRFPVEMDAIFENGNIDLMISIVRSEKRDEIFDFSKEPVVTVWGQVYTSGKKKLSNIPDADSCKLAAIVIVAAMGLFGLLYLWIKRLKQRVRRRGKALAESEEKFRRIVDSSPPGMHFYKMDAPGNLIFTGANPAADAILGVDNRQFIGKTIEQAFPALAETETPRRYRQVCTLGEPWRAEQITYDEGRIKGAFEVTAFRTAPGVMAVMFQEISERIQTRQALKRSEERFRSLVEYALVGICIVKEGRLVYMNPEFETMLGDHSDLSGACHLILSCFAKTIVIGRSLFFSECHFSK